jgi:hypothetical protein
LDQTFKVVAVVPETVVADPVVPLLGALGAALLPIV